MLKEKSAVLKDLVQMPAHTDIQRATVANLVVLVLNVIITLLLLLLRALFAPFIPLPFLFFSTLKPHFFHNAVFLYSILQVHNHVFS